MKLNDGHRRFVAIALLATLITVLAGCSTSTSSWVNPQKPDSVFYMDEGQCQAQALSAPAYTNQGAIFNACMRGKGWLVQDTTWTGRPSSDFATDDFRCAGGGTGTTSHGPKWRQCLIDRGWTPGR